MVRPGKRNLITDVDGLRVGHSVDERVRSGVSILVPDVAGVAAVDVRGGAPGTRETDALNPTCLVDGIHAICLSGGSAFGLDAASGVAAKLALDGKGFAIGDFRVPIVPAAILFDLTNGGDKNWGMNPPYRRLGIEALDAIGHDFPLGPVGAGFGATAGRLRGGLGSASAVDADGMQVGAMLAINPVGSTVWPGSKRLYSAELAMDDGIGPQPMPPPGPPLLDLPDEARIGGNTTIGIVATNVSVTKAEAQRIAIMAQDGLARAIRPVHTPFDGDTIFVISTARLELTGARPHALARLGAIASDCVTRAIARGMIAAGMGPALS